MKKFILDFKKIGNESVRIGNTTYKLNISDRDATFHVIPDNAEPFSKELSFAECKALYLLLTTEEK